MQYPRKRAELELAGPTAWLRFCFPEMFFQPMAPHHDQFWDLIWSIDDDSVMSIALALARGAGKSAASECATVALGAMRRRRYAWYLCETQEMADKHVESMGLMLEQSRHFELLYPEHANRKVGQYGSSKGWRRNRLFTHGGFLVDAIGADTGARGAKMMEQRPDLLIIDDYDGRHDTTRTIKRKVEVLTQTIIPALSPTPVVVFPQNLIHQNSIMNSIVKGEADFLRGTEVIGPIPAIEDMEVEEQPDGRFKIVAGRATWVGQDIDVAERQIEFWGLTAFLLEAQHEVDQMPGSLWSRFALNRSRIPNRPEHLYRIGVGVDPATSGQGDRTGIIGFASGPAPDGATIPIEVDGETTEVPDIRTHGYVLCDRSELAAPSVWRETVAKTVHDLGATVIVVERNRLGETAKLTIQGAEYWDRHGIACPEIIDPDAKLDKKTRAQPIAAMWGTDPEDDIQSSPRMHIVGKLDGLEDTMATWEPDKSKDSPDDIDALVHVATEFMLDESLPVSVGRALGDESYEPNAPSVVRRAGRALGG